MSLKSMFTTLNNKFKQSCLHFVLFLLSYMPVSVFAALTTADEVADGANTSSPLAFLKDIFGNAINIAGTGIAAVITLGSLYTIYTSFVEAKEKNNWKSFGITAIVGVVMIVAGVVIAVLAIDYGTF